MPKSKQEEVDVLNKAGRDSSSAMQKSMFDTVTQTNRDQRQKQDMEKARRQEHYKSRIKSEKYRKSQDKLTHLTDEMKRTLTAMDSLATILFAIGSQAEALKEVMQYRIEENLKDKIGSLDGVTKNGINVRKHISTISNALFKRIVQAVKDNMTDPDVYLPGVIHFVELDEESKVKDAPLRFDSNIFVTDEQNKIFNADFKKWLNKNGYDYKETPNPDPSKPPIKGPVTDAKGVPIKKETFEALRDDPVHGLTRYLKDEWKMKNVKQEKARAEAPKEEPLPKKDAKKRAREEAPDEALDEAEDHAPRPRP